MMLHAAFRGPSAAAAAVAAPQLLRHLSILGSSCNAGSHPGGSSSENHGGGLVAAASAAVAAAAAAVCSTLPSTPALADAAVDDAGCSTVPDAARRARLTEWLAQHGGDTSAVAVQPSRGEVSGLGLFATSAIKQHMSHSWLGRRLGALLLRGAAHQTVTAATFPLELALTVEAAVSHPQLGSHFQELLELGVIDERIAVVLLLMIERARGEDSLYAPWLQLLPTGFDTPLFYSDTQLQELSGTTLAAATAARKAGLTRSWQQLQPAVQQMLQQLGVAHQPTHEDYLWATSIFWSRALALPITYSDTQMPQQQQRQQEGPSGSSGGSILRIKVLEGLVPGLDFANHSTQPKCWWEVEQAEEQPQVEQHQLQHQQGPDVVGPLHVVKLLANRACCPATGEELTISYGDKSNEELLLLYGFAQPQNPHETLMVLCPLPDPDDWDDVFTARMQLLQAKGLRPQLFLSTNHYTAATGQPLLVAPVAPPPDSSSNLTEEPSDTVTAARSSWHRSVVPQAARQILEVFVLDRRELATMLQQQLEQQQPQGLLPAGADSSYSSRVDSMQQQIEQLGLAMAVLTTFTRLLELKMIAMEGRDGTGPLEQDLKQLADDDAAAAQHEQQGAGSSSEWQGDGGSGLPGWKRQCLLYRAGQKALVRSYITAARAELQDTLAELQALIEARGD